MMCGLTAVIQAFQQSDLLTVAVVVIRGFQIKGQVAQNRMVNHAVSYTHLDVYKRQIDHLGEGVQLITHILFLKRKRYLLLFSLVPAEGDLFGNINSFNQHRAIFALNFAGKL